MFSSKIGSQRPLNLLYKVNGLKGTIRLKGLILIYFITFFQWMDDKNSSLEKTMTALDKNLDQAEKMSKLFL